MFREDKSWIETSTVVDQFVTSVNTYNDNQWHYAVVTNDGTTVILYIDGVQVGTKSTAGASPESSGTKPVRVGANSLSVNKFFNGGIDEVRVWSRAITAQEVSNAFPGSFDTNGQVLYLDFSDMTASLSSKYQYEPSLALSGPS